MICRSYDKEFKISAIKLILDSGRSVSSIAADLGVNAKIIFNSKKKYLANSNNDFPGKGHRNSEEEIWQLKKDLNDARME